MAPIALPQLSPSLKNRVRYPSSSPLHPPSSADLVAGIRLVQDLQMGHMRNEVDDKDLVSGMKYQMALFASEEGAEPAWFQAAMTRVLAPVQVELTQLNDRVATLDTRVAAMDNRVAALDTRISAGLDALKASVSQLDNTLQELKESNAQARRIAALMWNRGAGSGRDAVLEVVLFPGGDDPTREPHNLPPLLTRRAVETLRSEARNQYWLGYHPGQTPPPPAERITGILKALGVWL